MKPERFGIAQARQDMVVKSIRKETPDDLFLACASFEERSLTTAQCLSPLYRTRQTMIYVNTENVEGVQGRMTRPNLYKMIEMLARKAERVEVVEGSLANVSVQLDSLRRVLLGNWQPADRAGTVTIDATTFNRESLLLTCAILRSLDPKPTVRILYVSPSDHGAWLSRGFRNVRNVLGFSGVYDVTKPTMLIVLTGFEPDRVVKVIEEHEPQKVLMGIGDPPTTDQFLARNLTEQNLVLARQDVEQFKFPTVSIEECWQRLREVVGPYLDDNNIVLAPMSTKPSTLAAMLLAEEHPEIQITYCVPGEYNVTDYSSGAEWLYFDRLPV